MRKDRFTDEALRNARALAEAKQNDSESFSEAYDFARCQRPDGSFYAIAEGKQCRKGTKAAPAESKPKKSTRERMAAAYERMQGGDERSSKRAGKMAKLEEAIKDLKKKGAPKRGKLAEMRNELQGLQRNAKVERIAKKTGRSADDVARERNARADAKIKKRLAKQQAERDQRKMKTDFRKEVEEGARKRRAREAQMEADRKQADRGRKFLKRAGAGIKRLEAQYKVAQGRLQTAKAEKIMNAISRLQKQANKVAAEVEKLSPGARNRGELYVG